MTDHPARTLQRPCQAFYLLKSLLNHRVVVFCWHAVAGILPG
jgi:hypothetical protein